MTTPDRDRYRRKLEALATRLSGEVSDLREESTHKLGGEESATYPAVTLVGDEQPAAKAEGELVMQLMDKEQHLLAEVRSALQRLETGSFGVCVACGQPIGLDRLDALPYAARCVQCARKG